MATIKDVAKLANVSPGTVTRYFNKQPLKEFTRRKVEQAIKELNYTVNPIARSLRSKKTFTIGVLATYLNESFATSIITSAERYFVECGYSLIICMSSGNHEIERERLQFLMDKKIDGLILFATGGNSDLIREMARSGMPIVTIDAALEEVACDAVLADNINITYQVTEHLIAQGHRKIGIILGNEWYMTAKERFEGYRRALEDYKMELDGALQFWDAYSAAAGYNAMEYFWKMEPRPTAVIATNYDLSLGSVMYMNEHNIAVAEDMSFVAFDFYELGKVVKPTISVAVQPVEEIGQMAAKIVLERLQEASGGQLARGGQAADPAIKRLKFSFFPGDSVKALRQ